ncbi:MAG: ribosomal-processing cysteine protease Prp [Clostridiaceae bacterium]|nr:ribosomal-processing cysteine protease Prp [Clostridiaceae bacterium]
MIKLDMITVTLYRSANGYIRRFVASGHAGYAPEGSDIICAGISAIAQTIIGSLQDLAGLEPAFTLADGLIEIQTIDPDDMDPDQYAKARILTDALAIGCVQIEHSYGRKFVTVIESNYA